jgi:hypothetical protein
MLAKSLASEVIAAYGTIAKGTRFIIPSTDFETAFARWGIEFEVPTLAVIEHIVYNK